MVCFKTRAKLENEMGVPMTVMQYNSIITAIPANWKRGLSTDNIENYKDLPTIHIKIDNKNVELSNTITCKQIYREFVKEKTLIIIKMIKDDKNVFAHHNGYPLFH